MTADGQRRRRLTSLDVVVSDERGRSVGERGLAAWLRRVAPRKAVGTLSVALVSDRRIRELNRAYRGHDQATDVLSFPAEDRRRGFGQNPLGFRRNLRGFRLQPEAGARQNLRSFRLQPEVHLGDIVIARGVARRQARAAGHSPQTEFRVLALHGLLHLLGYDHERDAGTMLRAERRLRRRGGLREGLIERA
jgi:probable rRNA maturation factor